MRLFSGGPDFARNRVGVSSKYNKTKNAQTGIVYMNSWDYTSTSQAVNRVPERLKK